jgi:hypothetical protein
MLQVCFRYTLQIYASDIRFRYTLQIYASDLRFRSTLQIYASDLRFRSTLQIYAPDIRSRYTLQIYAPDIRYIYTLQIYAPDICYRYVGWDWLRLRNVGQVLWSVWRKGWVKLVAGPLLRPNINLDWTATKYKDKSRQFNNFPAQAARKLAKFCGNRDRFYKFPTQSSDPVRPDFFTR